MIIKREKYNVTTESFEEVKQEATLPDASTLAVDERIHICYHDETPVRPCKTYKK